MFDFLISSSFDFQVLGTFVILLYLQDSIIFKRDFKSLKKYWLPGERYQKVAQRTCQDGD